MQKKNFGDMYKKINRSRHVTRQMKVGLLPLIFRTLQPEEKNIFSSINVYLISMNIGHNSRYNIRGITFFQVFIIFRQGGTS